MLDTAQGLKNVEQFRDAVMAVEAIAKLVAEMGGVLPPQIDIRAGGEAIDIILAPLSFDLEKLREYNAQSRQQGNGNCPE
ncbi:hypothetical protein AGMMS50268_04120 [Spirochaetia bacterium]|nr:hypothetical protein AGMMS50268_04120 [Spirochaetia bacterium]